MLNGGALVRNSARSFRWLLIACAPPRQGVDDIYPRVRAASQPGPNLGLGGFASSGFEIFADEAGRISYKDLPNRFAQPFDFQVF
jgi:hypothetical protein